MADPLHDLIITTSRPPRARHWLGLLVEPVPSLLYKLRHVTYRAYADDFAYVAAAINSTCPAPRHRHGNRSTIPFFAVDMTNISDGHWMAGIGSLSVPRTRAASVYKRITVTCLTMAQLAEPIVLHGLAAPTILLIDVEGYDAALVQALAGWPFGRPALIVFEMWPPAELPEHAYMNVMTFLNAAGYVIIHAVADWIAVDALARDGT